MFVPLMLLLSTANLEVYPEISTKAICTYFGNCETANPMSIKELSLVFLDALKAKDEYTKTQKEVIANEVMKYLDDFIEKMDKNIDAKIYAALRPSIKEFVRCYLDKLTLSSSCC